MFVRPLRVCWKPQVKTSQRSGIRIEIIVVWPTRAVLIPLHANTPFQLMFGREMRIPLDVMIGEAQGRIKFGEAGKFHSQWQGPFQIVTRVIEVTYLIKKVWRI